MRYFVLGMALSLSAVAFGQSAGTYVGSSMPLISTPSVSFPTPVLRVGASNATEGNAAGAGSLAAHSDSTQKVSDLVMSLFVPSTSTEVAPVPAIETSTSFNTGASIPQEAFGAAQLAGGRSLGKPAVRTFTNADVQQLRDAEAK
jgi:hypothetical protein